MPLYGALPVPYVPVRTRCCDCTSVHSCASLLQNPAYRMTFIPLPYLCGTILETPYSMVRDYEVSRGGPMFFYWSSCSLHFCLLLFSLSILSFYEWVLWGWGLRSDRVLITLSKPFTANLLNNDNNNNNNIMIWPVITCKGC